MATLLQVIASLQAFNIESEIQDSLQGKEVEMVAANQLQLLDGKDRNGDYLKPTYFQDPYFKNPQSAALYSAWKDRIDPFPGTRPSGIPNLYITGKFHDSIRAAISQTSVSITSPEYKIVSAYPLALGLNPQTKNVFAARYVRPYLINSFKYKTALR